MTDTTPTGQRVTVTLTPRATQALHNLTHTTGHNKTDTINRALQICELLQNTISNGGHLYLRPSDNAPLERLHIC